MLTFDQLFFVSQIIGGVFAGLILLHLVLFIVFLCSTLQSEFKEEESKAKIVKNDAYN